jgi:hypothetical protein
MALQDLLTSRNLGYNEDYDSEVDKLLKAYFNQ